MGKKSGKTVNPSKRAERMVTEAFELSIRMAKRSSSSSRATKIYDLAGTILKRRKQAVLALMDNAKERYSSQYPELDMELEWARQCSAMGHTVDGADHLYHITLAAAIWMLDTLKQSGRLRDAMDYIEDEGHEFLVQLPEMSDPCHDDQTIRNMMWLIQERDKRDNPYQWHINDISAQRRGPEKMQPPETDDVDEMTYRQRFDAVLEMIHPILKERAVQRFENKIWEFLDLYFKCASAYAKKQAEYEKKMEQLTDQLDAIIDEKFGRKTKNAGPVSQPKGAPFAVTVPPKPPTQPFPPITSFTSMGMGTNFRSSSDRFDYLVDQVESYEQKIDDIESARTNLLLSAHMAPMMERKELADGLEPEIVDALTGFTVDDPYETIFGYLCLIESGSDLPWLYNAPMAVLLAAARKLPWNASVPDLEELRAAAEGGDADSEEDGDTELPDEIPLSVDGPRDWTHIKKPLYELKYADNMLYAPLESPTPGRMLNLPQLVYGLTGGAVMPRKVSDYYGMAEEFTAVGMPEDAAKIMELYLQLAADVQSSGRSWDPAFRTSLMRHIDELYERIEDISESSSEADAEELRTQLIAARRRNDELKKALYAATRQAEESEQKAVRMMEESANERQELQDLRELVFNRKNNADDEGEDAIEDDSGLLPYNNKNRIVVFGGHDTWLKAIRPLLPSVLFVPRSQNPNADMIRSSDVVWIQANSLSHKHYYKIINIVRTHQIPVRYFGYASARKCAIQLAKENMGS